MPAILEAREVRKIYREGTSAEVRALWDVTLRAEAETCIGLAGASGSGKTTLLALLAALDRPSYGQVLFQGRNLRNDSDLALARVRRQVGFIFQGLSLIPSLPVWENITYPLIPRGVSRPERFKLAQSLLEQLRMPNRHLARPQELSGGEQQRVAIARAIASRPQVILADEPTSDLDSATAEEVISILKSIHAAGTTLILSSHDSRVLAMATTIYRLEGGRLMEGNAP